MPILLTFNLSPEKRAAVVAAAPFACRCIAVTPESFGAALGDLTEARRFFAPVAAPFTEELLVMAGLNDKQLDALLLALRRKGVTLPLKAVLTPTNARWTAQALYEELCRERAAFAAARP